MSSISHANIDVGDRNIPEPHDLVGAAVSQRQIIFTGCQLSVLLMLRIYILNRNAGLRALLVVYQPFAGVWGCFSPHYYFEKRR